MEPLTLSALTGAALTEGIKFLYSQAGEVLRRRRAHKEEMASDEPIDIVPSDVLDGALERVKPDWTAFDRFEASIRDLRRTLSDFADGADEVDPRDHKTLATVDALRRALEVVLRQRITLKGERRSASGPLVFAHAEVEQVAGYVAAVRSDLIMDGGVEGSVHAEIVHPGGEVVGVDARRIGAEFR